MITIEYIGNGLERVRSTENVKIRRDDGAVFEDVIHPTGSAHVYTETDIPIEDEVTVENKNAALRRFGVEV